MSLDVFMRLVYVYLEHSCFGIICKFCIIMQTTHAFISLCVNNWLLKLIVILLLWLVFIIIAVLFNFMNILPT